MMKLSQAATTLRGELCGDDALFTAVSKDTRSIVSGDLYVALKGERFDGHAFVDDAEAGGAVGALVSEQQTAALPQICVTDTRLALGELAANWRQKFNAKLIGVTGSNGKTTVKEMCTSILAKYSGAEHVLSTQGNLNNDIGMPMTLLSLREVHQYAVIEMGANHAGEIDYLTHIAKPDIAIITNAGPAHIEGFGSVEQVAKAKAEIYGGLSKNGVAIINKDDEYTNIWLDTCRNKKVLTFSLNDASADVFTEMNGDGSIVVHTPVGEAELKLKVPGEHNVMNALAAIASCIGLGIDLHKIIEGLADYAGVAGRLMVSNLPNGASVIDDTYNANPLSLAAAIKVLVAEEGKHWLVLGDMAELGPDAKQYHEDAGVTARTLGVERLFAMGDLSRNSARAFGTGGEFFSDRQALVDAMMRDIDDNTVILVKGSRSMAMEHIVNALQADNNKLGVN